MYSILNQYNSEYVKLYAGIIETARGQNRTRQSSAYYESHHIIPDFMFKQRKRSGPRGHIRQRTLTAVDIAFLDEMSHIRQIGLASISCARKGKMPVVDAISKNIIGSVEIDHPNVLAGIWVHHSKGKKSPNSGRDQRGCKNANYKHMTIDHHHRIFSCIKRSIIDNKYFSSTIFAEKIKEEFNEFKKISIRWVLNNFSTFQNLVDEYNRHAGTEIEYNPYYRNLAQRQTISANATKWAWVTNGLTDMRVLKADLQTF